MRRSLSSPKGRPEDEPSHGACLGGVVGSGIGLASMRVVGIADTVALIGAWPRYRAVTPRIRHTTQIHSWYVRRDFRRRDQPRATRSVEQEVRNAESGRTRSYDCDSRHDVRHSVGILNAPGHRVDGCFLIQRSQSLHNSLDMGSHPH
jgi:hypothetical protein